MGLIKSPSRKDVQEFAEKIGFPPGSHVFDIHVAVDEVSVSCHLIDDERGWTGDVKYTTFVTRDGDV